MRVLIFAGIMLSLPGTAAAEVCDKLDCGDAGDFFLTGALASVVLVASWSFRHWLGALLTLPMIMLAGSGVRTLWDPLFGSAIHREVSWAHIIGAYGSLLLPLGAIAAGAHVRRRHLAGGSSSRTP